VEPEACGGCDLPTFAVKVTEYLMMRKACGCGRVTTAAPPAGVRGGPACYGPDIVAASTLLGSTDVIGIERTAELMSDLLGVQVSTGFVSSCLVRLGQALIAAGFEEALKERLRAADVLGTDETSASLTTKATAGEGCHNPHVYTVRTMCAYTGGGSDVVWYGAAGNRTKASISAFGILDDYTGVLVRDDYGGYDEQLAGVQQCLAHLCRYLDDA
jgi:transposase